MAKLRTEALELAQLKAAAASRESNPTQSTTDSAADLVNKLKAKLAQAPEQTIPELQFLTDQDWLKAVKDMKRLETDDDFRRALIALRSSAKKAFGRLVQGALIKYAQSNNGQSPSDMAQLAPYFASPADASVLERYGLTPEGLVNEKATPLADQDDTYYQISREGVGVILGSVAERTLSPAFEAFTAAHNGQKPKEPSQLLPYVKTPAEQAALQNLIQNPAVR